MPTALWLAGVRVDVDCQDPRWEGFVRDSGATGTGGDGNGGAAARTGVVTGSPSVRIELELESSGQPFPTVGWQPLSRGSWHRPGQVLLADAGGSGTAMRVSLTGERLRVEARRVPDAKRAMAARLLPGRQQLLLRAVLLHYPALWAAGLQGFVPVHASVLRIDGRTMLLAGPGGVGKSTLVQHELAAGARLCSDNLAVTDGRRVRGLAEPLRLEGGTGRRMPHGRRERPAPIQVGEGDVDGVVAVHRNRPVPALEPCDAGSAARVLVAGTYAAGELRRYWSFAALLALGTGAGAPHPPVAAVAAELCSSVPTSSLCVGAEPGPHLSRCLSAPEVPACP